MTNYDFNNILSPLDFEHLVRDLLSRDLGIDLSTFSEGPDGGIDLRYSVNKDDNTIVQCKRVKDLSKTQIKKEFEKVKILKPSKYYFVISIDISPQKIDFIKEIFNEWMDGDPNIYTKSRLNRLLDKYQDVHQKHYKLWLNSSSIFNDIVNQPLYERAKSLISDIKRDYKYYVRNEGLTKAFEILNQNQFIIISGIPGIGKTTLAKIILWEYLQKQFEVIEIRKIIEGEQILVEDSHKKQVFYYDDFLGENFLKFDVIEGRSNDLIQLITRIKNSSNKVLIMTTREYILNQAKDVYEKLASSDIDLAKHTLDLSSYSKRIKSQILYNHLYYSNIHIDYIKNIIESKAYKEIINHNNYSPRIIEQLTKKLKHIEVENYSKEFIYNLDHPFGIWDKAFNSQISEGAKLVLYLLLSISGPILLSDLREALNAMFNRGTRNENLDFSPFHYKNYLQELENSFIVINVTSNNNHYIDFLNPSIKDFLLSIVQNDIEIVKLLLESCIYLDQFVYTIRYLAKEFVVEKEIRKLINRLILSNFDKLKNHSKISTRLRERISECSSLDKISKLKFYLYKSQSKKVKRLFYRKFEEIEISTLSYYKEYDYLDFYSSYREKLKIEYLDVIKDIVDNILWYDNIKNLSELRNIDEIIFDQYTVENQAYFDKKIKDSIINEIEFYDDEDSLLEFREELVSDTFLSNYSLSLNEFDSYFDDHQIKLSSKNNEQKSNDETNLIIDKDENVGNDDYDEDELFKLEMF